VPRIPRCYLTKALDNCSNQPLTWRRKLGYQSLEIFDTLFRLPSIAGGKESEDKVLFADYP